MGFFEKIKAGLTRTKENIGHSFDQLFAGELNDDFYDELEETLILGDMGVETTMKAVEELRRRVILVPQTVSLYSGTIRENLRMAAPSATDGELLEALDQVRLKEWVLSQPEGLDTSVGDAGGKLSGGQRQSAFIAMVLAQDTPVVLFDEPTSFLDVSACYEVMELMRSLKEEHGKTVVAVIHDIDLALRYSDEVCVMRDGKLLAQGAPQEAEVLAAVEDAFDVRIELLHGELGSLYALWRR